MYHAKDSSKIAKNKAAAKRFSPLTQKPKAFERGAKFSTNGKASRVSDLNAYIDMMTMSCRSTTTVPDVDLLFHLFSVLEKEGHESSLTSSSSFSSDLDAQYYFPPPLSSIKIHHSASRHQLHTDEDPYLPSAHQTATFNDTSRTSFSSAFAFQDGLRQYTPQQQLHLEETDSSVCIQYHQYQEQGEYQQETQLTYTTPYPSQHYQASLPAFLPPAQQHLDNIYNPRDSTFLSDSLQQQNTYVYQNNHSHFLPSMKTNTLETASPDLPQSSYFSGTYPTATTLSF